VRNPACILGPWLHHPTDLEESDASQAPEAAEVVLEPEDQLKAMPIAERVQLLVKAKLMSQDEADQAKRKLAEDDGAGRWCDGDDGANLERGRTGTLGANANGRLRTSGQEPKAWIGS
jgi:hypothetical protein